MTTLNLGFGRTIMGLSSPLKSGSAGDTSPFLKEEVADPFRQLSGDREIGVFLFDSTTAGDTLFLVAGVAGDLPAVAGDLPEVASRFEGDICSFVGDSDLLF